MTADHYIFNRTIREALGYEHLQAWKDAMYDAGTLKQFYVDNYPGDVEILILRMKTNVLDSWLYDFLQTDAGLLTVKAVTPVPPDSTSVEEPEEDFTTVQIPGFAPVQVLPSGPIIQKSQRHPHGEPKAGHSISTPEFDLTYFDDEWSVTLEDRSFLTNTLQSDGDPISGMESHSVSSGTTLLIIDPCDAKPTAHITLKKDGKLVSSSLCGEYCADNFFILDLGGNELLVVGDEPAPVDIDCGTELEDEHGSAAVSVLKSYNADYVIIHM